MGEYMERCEKILEVAVEVANGCTKTRTMEDTSEDSSKRRKIDSGELLNSSSLNDDQMANQDPRVVNSARNSLSPATSAISDHVPASLCSSKESSEFVKGGLKSSDLKDEGSETEISALINGGFSRETTPSSDLCANSEEMESSGTQKKPSPSSSGCKQSASKMPSAAELEEFFAKAEKYEQKRFADKYNYDIVKDLPLEGRFEWVRLKP